MESVSLLQAAVRSRKDVVRVLHQARQLAKFLRFSPLEQVEIGCQVFALAFEISNAGSHESVVFHLSQGSLLIGLTSAEKKDGAAATYRFRMRMPESTEMSRDDFIWVIAQIQVLLKVDALQVIRQQNNDLLEISHALRCCRQELDELRNAHGKSPAA